MTHLIFRIQPLLGVSPVTISCSSTPEFTCMLKFQSFIMEWCPWVDSSHFTCRSVTWIRTCGFAACSIWTLRNWKHKGWKWEKQGLLSYNRAAVSLHQQIMQWVKRFISPCCAEALKWSEPAILMVFGRSWRQKEAIVATALLIMLVLKV